MAAGSPIGDGSLVFDMKELSFALQTKGSIVQFLFLEADRFGSVAQLIDERNKIVLSEVWPRLSTAKIPRGQRMDSNEIRDILTVGIVRQLEVLTDGIIKNLDENVISSRALFNQFRIALKEIYPKRKFIDFGEELAPAVDTKKAEPMS